MMEKLYKTLGKDGRYIYGNGWHLPKGKRPGKWMPVIEELLICESGYHLCKGQDLVYWLNEEIYEAEYRGERIDEGYKIVVSQARLLRKVTAWNETTARLFACDCAEHVLPIYKKDYPDDETLDIVIYVSRCYALGGADENELNAAKDAVKTVALNATRAAAKNAVNGAARDTAWAAAWAAAWATAEAAAMTMTRDAPWAAARRAVRYAAWITAWDAERKWQTERLFQYLNGKEQEGG